MPEMLCAHREQEPQRQVLYGMRRGDQEGAGPHLVEGERKGKVQKTFVTEEGPADTDGRRESFAAGDGPCQLQDLEEETPGGHGAPGIGRRNIHADRTYWESTHPGYRPDVRDAAGSGLLFLLP